MVEILADFNFIICVFFRRALDAYRIIYAYDTEITPSASKQPAHFSRLAD